MHRQYLLKQIHNYVAHNKTDIQNKQKFIDFINSRPNCFERDNDFGHITASSWVISADESAYLLLHHRKLNIWCHPGGHCDGETNTLVVAQKELAEEAGLENLNLLHNGIFSLAIFNIPKYADIPAHLHFDVTYIFKNDKAKIAKANNESYALKWVNFAQNSLQEKHVNHLAEKSMKFLKDPKLILS